MKYLLSIGLALGLAGPAMAQAVSPDKLIRNELLSYQWGRTLGVMVCYAMLDNRASDTKKTLIREAMYRYAREGASPGLLDAFARLEDSHPAKDAAFQGMSASIGEHCPGFDDLP